MTDGTGRPEFFPLRFRGVGWFACIGAFDLKCGLYEIFAARLANETGIANHYC